MFAGGRIEDFVFCVLDVERQLSVRRRCAPPTAVAEVPLDSKAAAAHSAQRKGWSTLQPGEGLLAYTANKGPASCPPRCYRTPSRCSVGRISLHQIRTASLIIFFCPTGRSRRRFNQRKHGAFNHCREYSVRLSEKENPDSAARLELHDEPEKALFDCCARDH